MTLSLKPSQQRPKRIAQIGILCVSVLLLIYLNSPIHVFSRQTRQVKEQRRTHVVVTRSQADPRSDVWLSVLQALSKARHLQTTILDAPLRHSTTTTIKDGKDASLEILALALEWRHAPHFINNDNINYNSSIEATEARGEALSGTDFDILLTTSCASDLLERPDFYNRLLERTTAILYCIVDDVDPFISASADSALTSTLQSWADELRLQFITLSDDVAHILRHEWAAKAPLVTARLFPPIFDIPFHMTLPYDKLGLEFGNASIAVMQEQGTSATLSSASSSSSSGLNDAMHRFVAAKNVARKNRQRLGNALIIGDTEVLDTIQRPQGLLDKDFERVSSTDMVDTVKAIAGSTSIVVVTSNAQKGGKVWEKGGRASSVVPLAIIAGVPPVVDEEIFTSHVYLDQDAAIVITSDDVKHLLEKGEVAAGRETTTDVMDMMKAFEYLAIPDFQQARKRRAVETLRTTLLVQNTHKLQAWILQDTRRAAVSFKVQQQS